MFHETPLSGRVTCEQGDIWRELQMHFFLQLSLVRRQKLGPLPVARQCLRPVRCVWIA